MVLDLQYFRELFQGLSLGEKGFIALYKEHGSVLMHHPYVASMIGYDLRKNSNAKRISRHPEQAFGHFFSTSDLDSTSRLYSFIRVPKTELIILLTSTTDFLLTRWYTTLYSTLALLALTLIICALFYYRLRTELKNRVTAEQELSKLAQRDGLTGLLNRRRIDELMNDLYNNRSRSPNSPLSILFIDVDFFKLYNDTYGHKSGDQVLTNIAQSISQSLPRSSDYAARYGGEEFIVLLNHTDPIGACTVAERLRASIETLRIPHKKSLLGTVTISVGVAKLEDSHTSIEQIIELADQALYRAKEHGRNNVQFHARELATE